MKKIMQKMCALLVISDKRIIEKKYFTIIIILKMDIYTLNDKTLLNTNTVVLN